LSWIHGSMELDDKTQSIIFYHVVVHFKNIERRN
jgi:hypothetical protein